MLPSLKLDVQVYLVIQGSYRVANFFIELEAWCYMKKIRSNQLIKFLIELLAEFNLGNLVKI